MHPLSIPCRAGEWNRSATLCSSGRSSRQTARRLLKNAKAAPALIVIIGGGAAGVAAADMIRREGYEGHVTMISAGQLGICPIVQIFRRTIWQEQRRKTGSPSDRMRTHSDRRIALLLGSYVSSLKDPREGDRARRWQGYIHSTRCSSRPAPSRCAWRSLERLPIPIHYLRTFADSQATIDALSSAKRAVVRRRQFHRSRGGRIAARARGGRGCRGTRPRAARACDVCARSAGS